MYTVICPTCHHEFCLNDKNQIVATNKAAWTQCPECGRRFQVKSKTAKTEKPQKEAAHVQI